MLTHIRNSIFIFHFKFGRIALTMSTILGFSNMPTSARPNGKSSSFFLVLFVHHKERRKTSRVLDIERWTHIVSSFFQFYFRRNTMSLRIATSRALRSASSASVTRSFSSLDRTQSVENYNAVLQKFAEIRACAVLRTATSEACPKAMQAAIDGGFKIVEFTLTTPGCLDHLADFRKKYDGDVMVGCGTILTVEDAEKAMDAGGEFIVVWK